MFTFCWNPQKQYINFEVALLLKVGTARICLRVSGCVCRLCLIKAMKLRNIWEMQNSYTFSFKTNIFKQNTFSPFRTMVFSREDICNRWKKPGDGRCLISTCFLSQINHRHKASNSTSDVNMLCLDSKQKGASVSSSCSCIRDSGWLWCWYLCLCFQSSSSQPGFILFCVMSFLHDQW